MTDLVRYDDMVRAIGEAYEVDEVKEIRDRAKALETYFRLAQNTENERRACEIRLRAERRAGALLKEVEKAKASSGNQHTGKVDRSPDVTGPKTLADMGITKNQSAQWQKMAGIPEDQFEAALATGRATTTGLIKVPEAIKDPGSVWLWGTLGEFDRNGIMDRDINEIIDLWSDDGMGLRIEIIPRLIEWLKGAMVNE